MKDQIEEIQQQHLEAITNSYYLGMFDGNDAAAACASITKKRMDIARLEGMIEGIKRGSLWNAAKRLRILDELEKQLENLKKE